MAMSDRENVYEMEHEKSVARGNKYITVPKAGGEQTLPTGDSKIDLEEGLLYLPSGDVRKIAIGKIEPTIIKRDGRTKKVYRALSFFIYTDKTLIVFMDETGGGGKTIPANSTANIRGIPIEKMVIRTTTSTKVELVFSVFPDAILSFEDVVPSTIFNGVKAVTAAAAQLTTTSTPVKGVSVIAESGNGASVYVGNASLTAANGAELTPGGSLDLDVDNLNKVYVIGTAGDEVRYIAVM